MSNVRGNPEIRFQANEAVQNSICNQIRYAASKEDKAKYHSELGDTMINTILEVKFQIECMI